MNSTINSLAILLSVISFIIANAALIIVLAQKWSTHKIEWKPLETFDPFKESDDEMKAAQEADGKILEQALNLQRKGKKVKDSDPLTDLLETNNF
jgi:hypothetical protein